MASNLSQVQYPRQAIHSNAITITECRSAKINKPQRGQFTIYKQCITNNILDNTNWKKISHIGGSNNNHVIISKRRLIAECQQSNPELPTIPMVMEKSMKHWPDWIKIINIASSGIYIGIRFGYDTENLCSIVKTIKDELPIDLITIIIHYSMETEIKSFILQQPMPLMNTTKYDKWVTNIQIRDFEQELNQISDNYKIDLGALKRCVDENGVDYSYLDSHSRREFTELLARYGIKTGPATKVFRVLCGKHEIEINYNMNHGIISSDGNLSQPTNHQHQNQQ